MQTLGHFFPQAETVTPVRGPFTTMGLQPTDLRQTPTPLGIQDTMVRVSPVLCMATSEFDYLSPVEVT